jgi:very-short-patch-repair endonuclease
MAVTRDQNLEKLAREQHDAVEREQLLRHGFTSHAIAHLLRTGRLHAVHRGVYAVGRRRLTRRGEFMAAVLRCGLGAGLMGGSAAALWGVLPDRPGLPIEVSVRSKIRAPGIVVMRQRHRRIVKRDGIPVTSLVCTFIDLAASPRDDDELEQAISAADIRGLINPEQLRSMVEREPARPGRARLRRLLDRRTFRVTRSKLERLFLALCRRAGLPLPLTRVVVNGYEVDFYWPELGLVVESDGLTYHRTPADQAADRERDQAHAAAGMTTLRFTHWQVVHEPGRVEAVLAAVARRLRATLPSHGAA